MCTLSRLEKELTHRNAQQGEQETRGVGEERKKTVGNRDMRRSVEGRGMGWGTQGKLQGLSGPYTTGTFRKESREFEGGGFGAD